MNGIERITAERVRQIESEGHTDVEDDYYFEGQLSTAAGCYEETAAIQVQTRTNVLPPCFIHKAWPWPRAWWKPTNDPVRNLEKAGALYLADADRLARAGNAEAAVVARTYANRCANIIDRLLKRKDQAGA